MSTKNFSKVNFIKSIDTGEEVRCGGFKLKNHGELDHIRPLIYIQGLLSGTERLRAKLYEDSNHTKLLATSQWTIPLVNATLGNWRGLIRIDFNKENINKNITYYIGLELTGYTRNGESFYIGVARDWPYPIYKITPTPQWFYQHPLAVEIFNGVWR